MNAIEIERLSVIRGGRRVLENISLGVPKGSVTGLLGPSGSGKTTLMRCIVGIQRLASGRVLTLGVPAGSAELRQAIGYMTQAPSVYFDLSVIENVGYFGALYGAGSAEVDKAIENVGLADVTGRLVATLSGGQMARVSLACVLVGRPDVLILDEPTVGQDPVLRQDLWQRFHALADSGKTLLVSSHVMDEARRCDHLLLLREGRLLAQGTPARIRKMTGVEDLDEAFLRLVLSNDPSGSI